MTLWRLLWRSKQLDLQKVMIQINKLLTKPIFSDNKFTNETITNFFFVLPRMPYKLSLLSAWALNNLYPALKFSRYKPRGDYIHTNLLDIIYWLYTAGPSPHDLCIERSDRQCYKHIIKHQEGATPSRKIRCYYQANLRSRREWNALVVQNFRLL